MKTMEEILSDEEGDAAPVAGEAVTEQPPVEEGQQDEGLGQPRDEHGRFAPKGVEEGAPPAPKDQLPPEEFKGLKDERAKRQQAEQRAGSLEAELAAIRQRLDQKPAEPPPPVPDFYEDQQGWQSHFGSQVVNASVMQSRIMMSEMLTAQQHPDFAEMKDLYLKLERENPALIPQVMGDPNPWNKAYQIAKNHQTMQDLGATDIDALKAKLREELMAEMAPQPQQAQRPALPASLSTERSVGSRSGPAWPGPTSLSDLLS